ncbi:MAG: hypothetical protein IJH09_05895 [Clostridia bacterium]|nr:hypothetical protein [Clostridia bacterium]
MRRDAARVSKNRSSDFALRLRLRGAASASPAEARLRRAPATGLPWTFAVPAVRFFDEADFDLADVALDFGAPDFFAEAALGFVAEVRFFAEAALGFVAEVRFFAEAALGFAAAVRFFAEAALGFASVRFFAEADLGFTVRFFSIASDIYIIAPLNRVVLPILPRSCGAYTNDRGYIKRERCKQRSLSTCI